MHHDLTVIKAYTLKRCIGSYFKLILINLIFLNINIFYLINDYKIV